MLILLTSNYQKSIILLYLKRSNMMGINENFVLCDDKEFTFIMLRPGAFKYGLFDKIMDKLYHIAKEYNLNIIYIGSTILPDKFIESHYAEQVGKPWYPNIKKANQGDPVMGFIIEGKNAIKIVRNLLGPKEVPKAKAEFPKSIRALHPDEIPENTADNLMHASTSLEEAYAEFVRYHDLVLKTKPDPKYFELVKFIDNTLKINFKKRTR